MPDLLGPDPCATCGATSPRPVCQSTCRTFLPYAAKRELLEALKAGGVKTNIYPVPVTRKEDSAVLPPFEGLVFAHMPTEGWLIFIPEAQP